MITRGTALSLTMVIALSTLMLTISSARHRTANAELASARAALQQTTRDAQSIIDLRSRSQTVETRQRPAQDVIAQVNAALAEVGIPSSHLRSLTPEAETSAAPSSESGRSNRPSLLKQSVRLTLAGLTPQQIGAFLVHWRSAQHIWITDRLEIVRDRSNRSELEDRSLAGNRYETTIVMTALYVAPPSTATQGAPSHPPSRPPGRPPGSVSPPTMGEHQ